MARISFGGGSVSRRVGQARRHRPATVRDHPFILRSWVGSIAVRRQRRIPVAASHAVVAEPPWSGLRLPRKPGGHGWA